MYTSLLTLVLTVQASTFGAEISWSQDYAQAQKLCTTENKPMAVILGKGAEGQVQLVRDGGLSKEATDILSTHYICVYIDTTSPRGKELASSFGMSNGIVLSDRSGVYERFRHEGTLTSQDLTTRLKIYSSATSTSNYRAGSTATEAGSSVVQPAVNYCPNCQGGTRYRR